MLDNNNKIHGIKVAPSFYKYPIISLLCVSYTNLYRTNIINNHNNKNRQNFLNS